MLKIGKYFLFPHFHFRIRFTFARYNAITIIGVPFFSLGVLYDCTELYPTDQPDYDWSKYL